jgi:hypothetical protein
MSMHDEPQNPKGHVPDKSEVEREVARGEGPTIDKPMHGPRKGPWMPLLVTALVIALVAAIYFFGLAELIPAG